MSQADERTLVSFDWAMKNILRDKANFDVLEGFLSTLLEEEIRVLSLLESEANQQHDLDKYNRVDLLAVDGTGQILIIELQYTWQAAYLKRLLYGTAKLIVENMKIGESFEKVRKIISISILYFPVSIDFQESFVPSAQREMWYKTFLGNHSDDDYLYHGKTEFVGLNNGKALHVDMAALPKPGERTQPTAGKPNGVTKMVNIFPEYYLIEVGHFQNIIRQPIDEWVYLFKNSQVLDEFHSQNIQAAKAKLALLQMSEAERKAYEQYQFSRANAMDLLTGQYQQGLEQGIEQGLEQGLEQGIERANQATARKMRQEGLDPALIARITGLPEAEILRL